MIWELLEALSNPDEGWAICIRDGELYLEELSVLDALSIPVRGRRESDVQKKDFPNRN